MNHEIFLFYVKLTDNKVSNEIKQSWQLLTWVVEIHNNTIDNGNFYGTVKY